MTCFAVYDTNVLLSAIPSGSDDASAVRIFDKITTGEIIPLVSPEMMAAYQAALDQPYYQNSFGSGKYLLDVIRRYGMLVDPSNREEMALIGFDLPFYEVVMKRRRESRYRIDPQLCRFPRRPHVITAGEMLELLEK